MPHMAASLACPPPRSPHKQQELPYREDIENVSANVQQGAQWAGWLHVAVLVAPVTFRGHTNSSRWLDWSLRD